MTDDAISDLDPIVLILQQPPGVNKLYRPIRTRAGSRMIKSEVARGWADRAAYDVRLQRGGRTLPYRFHALITLSEKRSDTDAFVKELFDACQNGGAIVNDAYNEGFTVEIDRDRPAGSVRVDLMPTSEKKPVKGKDLLKKLQDQPTLDLSPQSDATQKE